jgi:Fe-S-cluster-containing dehydrogenase component
MDKCNICAPRRSVGETPACVKNCAGGALHFGDINDPSSEVSRLLEQNKEFVFTLKDNENSRPAGRFILKNEEWIDLLPFEFEAALREGKYEE